MYVHQKRLNLSYRTAVSCYAHLDISPASTANASECPSCKHEPRSSVWCKANLRDTEDSRPNRAG